MRVVESIAQYICYAVSRTLTKIVGDMVAVSRYSAPGTRMSLLKFYRIKGTVDVSVNIKRSLLKLWGYKLGAFKLHWKVTVN